MEEQKNGFDQWCIVEIMGHQRLAGRVTEQTIAGQAFLRVDVPEVQAEPAVGWMRSARPAIPAFTTYLGAGSIYRLTPCTEAVARIALARFRVVPVQCVDLPAAPALPGPAAAAQSDERHCPKCGTPTEQGDHCTECLLEDGSEDA